MAPSFIFAFDRFTLASAVAGLGYFIGGTTTVPTTVNDRLSFTDDTRLTTTAMTTAREMPAGGSGPAYGWLAGGITVAESTTTADISAVVEKMAMPAITWSSMTALTTKSGRATTVGNAQQALAVGGMVASATFVANSQKIVYSSDTPSTTAKLTTDRTAASAFSNTTMGIIQSGGNTGSTGQVNNVDRQDFSTNAMTAQTAAGNAVRYGMGFSNTVLGVIAGGDGTGGTDSAVVNEYNMGASTWAAGTSLGTATIRGAGLTGSSTPGYAVGGQAVGANITTGNKYNMTAKTWSTITALNTARNKVVGIASSPGWL